MQRIRQRKYGRDGTSPHAAGASHIIKIGFDARGPRDARPVPGRLRGFLLVRDTLDANNQLVVDMECMSKYGVTTPMVEQAKREQLKAAPGLLPTELRFVLTHDARKEEGRWLYPGTFSEEYETWGKLGRFCHGDGVEANRRQEDGTRKQIECVPRGKEGTAADDWCPFSVRGDCRARSRLILCLYVEDRQGKIKMPMPVSDAFGWEARFRFDSTSEYNPVRILAALDEASNRLQGNLAGIPGTLSFAVQRKRTGNEESPVGVVGQIMFSLSEHEIAKRERELWNRRLEEIRIHSITGLPPQSSLPPPPDGPLPIQEDEDQVVVPDDAEAVEDSGPRHDTEQDIPANKAAPRDQVVAAAARLLEDYPSAVGVLSFDLADLFQVDTVEAVPEDRLPEALGLIRNIYKAERNRGRAQQQ